MYRLLGSFCDHQTGYWMSSLLPGHQMLMEKSGADIKEAEKHTQQRSSDFSPFLELILHGSANPAWFS
ncbi:hypothetical protein BsWGS_20092 [Bradybaena similaris]